MGRRVIICVDDERQVLLSLRDQLNRILENDYTIELAESGIEALELFAELAEDHIEVPLIICDQTMPEMDGVTLLSQLQHQHPRTLKILLTGLACLTDVIQAVNHANLYRYITKPWNETDLGLTVREALRRYEQEKQLAEQNQLLQNINWELQREIADRRRAEAQLAHDALHDALTGLPNRTLLLQRIEHAIHTTQENHNYQFAVLFIDLDRFKIVNDSLGHMLGDQLLVAIAQRLRYCLRNIDLVARLGGDEFTVVLENTSDVSEAVQIAERILVSLNQAFHLQEHILFPSASIGIVMGSKDYSNATDLLRDADLAMYRAKATGKGCYALFKPELHAQTLRLLHLESNLRQALEQQEFVLYYQPIIALETEKIVGFEALMRWQHPQQGFISPNDFIPFAEETGAIIPLGEWALKEACRQLRLWHLAFPKYSSLTISVNLAGKQLRDPRLVECLDQLLNETGIDSRYLKLELTESMLIENVEGALQTLTAMRARDIQLSIDDFGTGYSSLSYLPRFPIQTIKIDRTFIKDIAVDTENFEIVRAITTLAHSLGIDVVAEGIESSEAVVLLKKLGCQFGQGYLFSQPLNQLSVEQLLANSRLYR